MAGDRRTVFTKRLQTHINDKENPESDGKHTDVHIVSCIVVVTDLRLEKEVKQTILKDIRLTRAW